MQSSDSGQGSPQGTTPKSYPSTLPPWEAYKYFQPAIEKTTALVAGINAKQVLANDPMRIAFIAYILGAGATANMTTIPNNAAGVGIPVTNGAPLFLVQSVYGPLVQSEWYASNLAGGTSIVIIEARLARWPGQ